MSQSENDLSRREAWTAVLFATTVAVGVLWQVLGVAVQPGWLNPNLWRLGGALNQVFVALILVSWFWERRAGWAIVQAIIAVVGGLFYVWESNNNVHNYLLIEAPQRLSQILFPLGCLIVAFLVLEDTRLPRLCGFAYLFFAVSWMVISAVRGNVFLQMMFGFVNDVAAMFAEGGLALWLLHLAWVHFSAEERKGRASVG